MQLGGQPAIDYGQARAYLSRAEYAIEYEDHKTAKSALQQSVLAMGSHTGDVFDQLKKRIDVQNELLLKLSGENSAQMSPDFEEQMRKFSGNPFDENPKLGSFNLLHACRMLVSKEFYTLPNYTMAENIDGIIEVALLDESRKEWERVRCQISGNRLSYVTPGLDAWNGLDEGYDDYHWFFKVSENGDEIALLEKVADADLIEVNIHKLSEF